MTISELEQLRRELWRRDRRIEKLEQALAGQIPLTCQELADQLGKHISFVYAAKQSGLPMVAGRITRSDAETWIRETGFTKTTTVKNGQKRCRTKTRRRANSIGK